MWRIAARMVGGGGMGFAIAAAAGLGEVRAEEDAHVDLTALSGRVWPPTVTLDNRDHLEGGKAPLAGSHFADSVVARNPTEGGLAMNWKVFRLEEVLPINHDTAKFVFSFSDPDTEYTLAPCSTLQLGLRLSNGMAATRLYTPITPNHTRGGFECVIKRYPHGCFTPTLFEQKPGSYIYARVQHLKLKYRKGVHDSVGCIAAGTGIAPMMQVIRAVLSDPTDTTKVSLLFSNRRQRDILMKEELDSLQALHPDRFKVTYTLQEPPLGWEGEVGHINHSMVVRTMPPPTEQKKSIICLSGPDKMMQTVGGSNMRNTAAWRNTNDLSLPASRARQVSSPIANVVGIMQSGVLFECGYTDGEVYRF
eukprot:TRINITY_DN1028_c0_g1_i1.p1 TRINITY_DN1028_c0_g1~~TRINITY_DN1028_c0_g1_i1.p1  ORF type:complete len:363 (+),score=143.97 TRINITY_DN1028_c0_g1_i1:120-1208(+)